VFNPFKSTSGTSGLSNLGFLHEHLGMLNLGALISGALMSGTLTLGTDGIEGNEGKE